MLTSLSGTGEDEFCDYSRSGKLVTSNRLVARLGYSGNLLRFYQRWTLSAL